MKVMTRLAAGARCALDGGGASGVPPARFLRRLALVGLTRSRRSKCFARLVSCRWNRSVSVKGAWLLARGASDCAFVSAGELRRKKVREFVGPPGSSQALTQREE